MRRQRTTPFRRRLPSARSCPLVLAFLLGLSQVAGCSITPKDPMAALSDNSIGTEQRLKAMEILDATPDDPAYVASMRRLLFEPGVVQPVRLACFQRLYARDRSKLLELLELNLPTTEALEWRRGLCEEIAVLQWRDATPALVRSLARPMKGWIREVRERPEYIALQEMWGEGKVGDVVFDLLLTASPATQSNLRARCWELMFELGEEGRLVELLGSLPDGSADGMLRDLKRAWVELGVLPRTREEVLWVRTLQDDGHKAFWAAARDAMAAVPADVRRTMVPKDLGVAVAAAKAMPEVLPMTRDQAVQRLRAAREASGSKLYSPDFRGFGEGQSERLHDHVKALTWGDAVAMMLMMRALEDQAFLQHLFEIAERDHADRATEHGGVVGVDAAGRLELVEFVPTHRGSDIQFHASQAMFDAAYSAIGHFHLHATQFENSRNAGPHMGDFGYADSTGVNGFVFTSIDSGRLNADWYRRGRVAVDLGTVSRP